MITRGQNFKSIPLNVLGSSVFGRYPKISIEKTYNLYQSDTFLVPYAGYAIGIPSSSFNNGMEGRALFTSTKFERMVAVIGPNVYLVNVEYDQMLQKIIYSQVAKIGLLQTQTGVVYIAENNKPQIGISDGTAFYIYDPTLNPVFQAISLDFVPGYLTFHDTYFIMPSSGTNTWRLSASNDGTSWPNDQFSVGALQTKPDNVQAVVRFPSKGNMIFVMGSIVTEAWFDTGAQLFPYQRNNQFNIDYGCLNPATVAYMDEFVVWLAANEKSGPIIMYSDGGMPQKITTDGIDYLFSTLQNPQDSQGFLYRQDGHLFYHINFYSDNLSLYYDFTTHKFYHACDENLDYFIAAEVAFFGNQYYFVSKNNGNLFVFDTSIYTYQDVDSLGNVYTTEIPRIRTCANIRTPDQGYHIINDIGFTIESGETNYQQQFAPEPQYLIAQDGQFLVTQQDDYLITQQSAYSTLANTPRVDLSISIDGGASFSREWGYILPPIGQRKNKLIWWNLGLANDFVAQLKFWGISRFVVMDGECNIRN